MDQQQHRRIDEAAEKFAEAIKESYQAVADHTVSAQQLNAELTQQFFNSTIENLRGQADINREMAQEAMSVYMSLINSMFSSYYYQCGQERPWPHYPLFDSGDPTFAERVEEEFAGFGEQ